MLLARQYSGNCYIWYLIVRAALNYWDKTLNIASFLMYAYQAFRPIPDFEDPLKDIF